jgi:transcription-repair coupling factor (superfamily II helicase)
MLPSLLRAFRELPKFRTLSAQLPGRCETLGIGGLPGSSAAVLAAALAGDHPHRTFLIIAPSPSEAERWLSDLTVLMGDRVRLYPQREALGEEEPHYEIAGERVETIEALSDGAVSVVVTTVRATAERTELAGAVATNRLDVRRGDQVKPADLVARLKQMGYGLQPSVLDVAQYAVRGGIVDVYGFGMVGPTRVEWWGDQIESLRTFDLDTQRSEEERETLTILPVAARHRDDAVPSGPAGRKSLLSLVPPDTVVIAERVAGLEEVGRLWEEVEHHLELARRRGELAPARDVLFSSPGVWLEEYGRLGRLHLDADPAEVDFYLSQPEAVDRNVRKLSAMVSAGPTLILCDNEGQLERLDELLCEVDGRRTVSPNVTLAIGALHGGFVMPGLAVLTDHEIFRRARRLRRPRRYRQALASVAGSLAPGDYVVHLEHGIGIYRGIDVLTVEAGSIEVASLEYEGGTRLNVPLYKLDQIERFRSSSDTMETPPRLDRLGGTRWRKQREKTRAAIQKLAADLLDLYARRSITAGFAFPPDTRWQAELESAFLYEDTPDQRAATEAVKRDMEGGEPMDRLVVGDVGYGKTEVAVRAAFKAAVAGKQVAVLVPTTILAEQHARTFSDRLADFPVRIDALSRFRSPAEQRDILQRLREGQTDIIVGTHRLLSKDAEFRDLGLLIVDEEQRFGVKHKERLKQLRLQVDVLTLTATPIPRTLHLALSGLRDMSLIQTPPRDRSPVLTFVELWDDELLEEVVARELDRGGQVYFVHNRIETIDTIAERVRSIAPRARVGVAHGRVPETELDKTMRDFGAGELDVLVSTMIVESGLDVTNANTMIIHQAQNYGLAQLYQLRGRVGRGHRRAFCYLLVPDNVDPDAEERLKLLEHHTELGSGYRLALRDLENRGAGSLLGVQQSGHAHAIGFDLYQRWLSETVKALKGEGVAGEIAPPDVILDGPAHLPEAYVPDEDAKLDVYRRLSQVTQANDVAELRAELKDRFGAMPAEAERLLIVFELRALGAQLGLQSVIVNGDEARVKFRVGTAPRMAGLNTALDEVQFSAEVRQMVPLSLRLRRLGGLEIGPGLVRAFAAVLHDGTTVKISA